MVAYSYEHVNIVFPVLLAVSQNLNSGTCKLWSSGLLRHVVFQLCLYPEDGGSMFFETLIYNQKIHSAVTQKTTVLTLFEDIASIV
jgi:hypothetical protein